MRGVYEFTTSKLKTALLLDSPHSGRIYPSDFTHICNDLDMHAAEDRYVDLLLEDIPRHGADLLCATFPRSYIDANRAEDDIDPLLISEPWPYDYAPSQRARNGIGLIRRLLRKDMPLYDEPLSITDIQNRIEQYYRPYHEKIKTVLRDKKQTFGHAYFINMHSMPSSVTNYDFVLGTRHQKSCSPDFSDVIAQSLMNMGYKIVFNAPYQGAEIIQRHGKPFENIHAIQIEINKGIYLNEATQEKSKNFDVLKKDLEKLIHEVSQWTKT